MRLRPAFPLALLAGLAACGSPDDTRGPAPEETRNIATPAPPLDTQATPAPRDIVVPDRLGPVRIGDRVADLRTAGLAVQTEEPMEGSTCSYLRIASLPDVFVMLDGDKVVRIDIATTRHAPVPGLRVGQSEAEALRTLGPSARVEPHPYTGPDGHYLIVHRDGAPLGLIVETNGKQVEAYRFGRWDEVQWIEGCA